MFNHSLYLEAAKELESNPGQWDAYNSGGNCVVLAGPGSGKTKTLTIKLARFLAEDIDEPRGLACITYNNECARELETRLEALGIEASNRVFIGTVHSFSLTQIIMPYAKVANLGLPDGFSVATRAERSLALQRAYDKAIAGPEDPQRLDFPMGNYRRSILNRDSKAWQESNPRLAKLTETFEQELRALGRIDFDDMPLLAVRALKENDWLQEALLAKFPVLAVDEYQDLGRALHRMVMGLCFSAGMRLFAVGDADQSIYGFTGAHPELLQDLSNRVDVETVGLQLNYRCGTSIVNASSYALGEQRHYQAVDGAVDGTIFFHPEAGQYAYQANRLITEYLPEILARNPDIELGDIAVLYSAAWIGDSLVKAAQGVDLPFIRTDGKALYPRGSRLMRWLELCGQWCCGGWQSGLPKFGKISKEGRRLFAETIATPEDFADFQRLLVETLWSHRDATLSLHDWLQHLKASLLDSSISECRTMHDEAETLATFVARTEFAGDCSEMTLGDFAGQSGSNDALKLSTLHSSKGREFSVVVLFGMENGRLPRANSNQAELIEARRLFYVGFTRAKRELHLMYAANNPSPFVTEVRSRLKQ